MNIQNGLVKKLIFLYVGAACGTHINILTKLFPQFEYHLYDKEKFYKNLYKNPKIKIFNRYFTNMDAITYKEKNVVYVCDIRNLEVRKNDDKSNKIISDDMKYQMTWYKIMNPITALLKFRLEWGADPKSKIEYLDGTIYFQIWQGKHSTETRLVPNGKMTEYNHFCYECSLFHFNRKPRRKYYSHKIPCYGHCYDCTAEIQLLEKYINKFYSSNKTKKSEIDEKICRLGEVISKCLNKKLFKDQTFEKYKI